MSDFLRLKKYTLFGHLLYSKHFLFAMLIVYVSLLIEQYNLHFESDNPYTYLNIW